MDQTWEIASGTADGELNFFSLAGSRPHPYFNSHALGGAIRSGDPAIPIHHYNNFHLGQYKNGAPLSGSGLSRARANTLTSMLSSNASGKRY